MFTMEHKTSTSGGMYSKDQDGSNWGFCVLKHYDASDVELTTQASIDTDCVKSVMDWTPTFDYEIIGGTFRLKIVPTSDFRLWVLALPGVADKLFVSGVNFKFLDAKEEFRADGRSSKFLKYNDPVAGTNTIRLIFRHDTGVKQEYMVVFEIYKA